MTEDIQWNSRSVAHYQELALPLVNRALNGFTAIKASDGPELVVRVALYVRHRFVKDFPDGCVLTPPVAERYYALANKMIANEAAKHFDLEVTQ